MLRGHSHSSPLHGLAGVEVHTGRCLAECRCRHGVAAPSPDGRPVHSALGKQARPEVAGDEEAVEADASGPKLPRLAEALGIVGKGPGHRNRWTPQSRVSARVLRCLKPAPRRRPAALARSRPRAAVRPRQRPRRAGTSDQQCNRGQRTAGPCGHRAEPKRAGHGDGAQPRGVSLLSFAVVAPMAVVPS